MKNFLKISLSGFFAILIASCSSVEISDELVVNFEECGFSAVVGDSDSKTHIASSSETAATVAWDNGDALSVFSKSVLSPSNNKFTISNISGKTADFTGSVEEKTTSVLAVYPYNSSASFSGGNINGYSIPTTQSASAGSFMNGSAIAIATGSKTPGVPSCGSLSFKNLCAVLSFTLPENITFAKTITIKSKGSVKMVGDVSIDASAQSITSASSDAITLTGTFVGGSTYFVLVAPGAYNGFTFDIATNANNSYSRETNNSFTAEAGHIYKLGKLSLNLTASDFTSQVTISHTVTNGVLEGSKAFFTLNPKPEFAAAIKHYNVIVSIKKNSQICRTLSYDSNSIPSSVEMTVANSQYYLAKGEYSYNATVNYIVTNGEKDVTRSVSLFGNVSAGSPSGLKIDANVSGHTSYNTYLSSGASAANAEDGSSVYGLGAAYKSGFSENVASQCASLISFTPTLDGSEVSGTTTKSGLSWAAHTIGSNWSFDGSSGTCATTSTVQVTGLPYNVEVKNMNQFNNDWTFGDDKEYKYEDGHLYMRGKATGSKKTSATFKGFNVPANINVVSIYKIGRYGLSYSQTIYFKVGQTVLVNDSGKTNWTFWTSPNNAVLTPSEKTVYTYISGSSSSWATGQSKVQYVAVKYR